jgi:NAD(P)-dependent dehydrogenase (short-subunit alcohol dehydrogenase family)
MGGAAARSLIVTGSGRGIGAATARLAARRGWAVCVNYRERAETAEGVVAEIIAQGGKAIAVRADTSDEAAVISMFEQTAAELGPVAGLVNNVGIPGRIGRVEDLDLAMLRRVLEINVVGSFLCAREAVRRMSTRHGGEGGAIVNLSSMGAETGSPGELVHYAAAKGAIESFTRGLAREVAMEGIRVNAVSPGLIETEIHAEAGDADRLVRYATRMPMARAGRPEEVAEAIIWFLSDAASYVTATILPVAGGR